jgi:hypothetical protein
MPCQFVLLLLLYYLLTGWAHLPVSSVPVKVSFVLNCSVMNIIHDLRPLT